MPRGSRICVLDGLLDGAAVEAVRAEIVALKEHFEYDEENPRYVKYRMRLDRLFEERREQSAILNAMQAALFDPSVIAEAQRKVLDFSVQSLPYTNSHFTYVTAHLPGKPCGWHKNDMTHHLPGGIIFTLNFIYYVSFGKFKGGDLLVSHDNIAQTEAQGWDPCEKPRVHETVAPRPNRLVILPTTYWHMVEPIEVEDWQGPLDGRVTINGHIGFRLA